MLLRKVRLLAELVGFGTLIFLAIYGAFALFQNATTAQAQGIAAPLSDQSTAKQSISLQTAALASTVPEYIGYQGVLRDGEGKLISGQVNVTFRIYDSLTAQFSACRPDVSPCLWEEKHSNITVRDGRFSVLLGNAGSPIPSALITSPDRFIGVQVEGYAEMQPRQRFSSVPYAMRTDYANNLSAPDGNPLSAVSVTNDGWVGIGTTTPSHPFHVKGPENVGLFESTGAQAYLRVSTVEGINNRVEIANRPGGRLALWVAGAGDTLNITKDGLVGIGTAFPQQKLHVAGGSMLYENVGHRLFFTTGDDVDMYTENDSLWLNSHGGDIILNGHEQSGNVRIGKSLNIQGDLTIGDSKPIFFQRFGNLGNPALDKPTGIPADKYMCGIAGWAVLGGDIQESNAGDYIAETQRSGDGTWHIKANFHWQSNPGSWAITLICVDKRLAGDRGGIP